VELFRRNISEMKWFKVSGPVSVCAIITTWTCGMTSLAFCPSLVVSSRASASGMRLESQQLLFGELHEAEEHDAHRLHPRRRNFLGNVGYVAAGAVSLAFPNAAGAATDGETTSIQKQEVQSTKPFAPIEALVPAARVKLTIDRSLQLVLEIQKHPDEVQQNEQREAELERVLLRPQNYLRKGSLVDVASGSGSDSYSDTSEMVGFFPPIFRSEKYQPAKAYVDTYERNRRELPLLFQPGAFLVQSGEIDSWRRLKRQEAQKETQDEVRAALNAYTQALSYRADAYLLKVSAQERSQMVRQNKLPDVKQVIASDLGMRYLYRNQLLTSMAEVKAELEYQLRQKVQNKSTAIDTTDLMPLLQDAQSACDKWFALIEPDQVSAALQVAQKHDGDT
jgi:hypothetical protein